MIRQKSTPPSSWYLWPVFSSETSRTVWHIWFRHNFEEHCFLFFCFSPFFEGWGGVCMFNHLAYDCTHTVKEETFSVEFCEFNTRSVMFSLIFCKTGCLRKTAPVLCSTSCTGIISVYSLYSGPPPPPFTPTHPTFTAICQVKASNILYSINSLRLPNLSIITSQ